MRLPVSVVTWRQAAIRMPLRGLSLANCALIELRTGMNRPDHSMRSRPLRRELQILDVVFHHVSLLLQAEANGPVHPGRIANRNPPFSREK